jgi:hypothetical protein
MKARRNKLVKLLAQQNPNMEITEATVFGNYQGMRLSMEGYTLMKKDFDFYKFQITARVTPIKKVILNKNMDTPYYMTDKNIFLFSQVDAFSLQVIGDVSIWIESISI